MLAMLGVIILGIALFAGYMAGELKRIKDDPKLRRQHEEEKTERARQQAWKDKVK
jgi:hypothetical protein